MVFCFVLTADMIQKRFQNIKETYTKNLNKIKDSQRSDAGDEIFKPAWYIFQFCSFLEKACAQAESSDNLQSTGTANLKESAVASSVPTYLLDQGTQVSSQINPCLFFFFHLSCMYFIY